MSQMELPIFPVGCVDINQSLAFNSTPDGTVIYYHGCLPVFQHHKDDTRSQRLAMAQLYINGTAKQTELSKAFGINVIAVKRAVALFREKGPAGFFEPPKRGGARILTPDVIEAVQAKIGEGKHPNDIAEEMGIKVDTIKKAIQDGRLEKGKKKLEEGNKRAPKSERSVQDANAALGMGAADLEGRSFARLGLVKGRKPEFINCVDVPRGGVLFALPALLAMAYCAIQKIFSR